MASALRHSACELWRKLSMPLLCTAAVVMLGAPSAWAQATHSTPAAEAQAAQGHAPEAVGEHAAEGEHAAGEHGGLAGLLWPTANFIILCGLIYHFFGGSIRDYVNTRSAQIRKDLLEAADLNRTATAQLAEVDAKLAALPQELDALRSRSTAEIAAEERRIADAAVADRERMLSQARREIDTHVRTAQRELSDHAAELAVKLAGARLATDVTPADHARLVDRFIQQVKG